jgi:Flp pilus assembly protein TadD
MKRRHLVRVLWASVAMAALIATAAPAAGQAGSIARVRGRVVDEKSQPVADAEITMQSVGGDQQNEYKMKTGRDGVFQHAGVYAGSGAGVYTIVARKGDLEGEIRGVAVKGGMVNPVPDIIMAPAVGGGATKPGGARMTAAEIADFNRKQEELKKLYEGVNADIDAKNYDGAIAKLQAIIDGRKDCANCYAALGGVHLRKGDLANAEKAHLEAIKLDPKLAASYDELGTIYNQQRKFAEAAKMTTMAMELNQAAAASAGAAGGGAAPSGNDAKSMYNQGVIMWNQSKIPEARAFFERAVKLDPKYANAQYQLGLALYSEGKGAEAKGPLQEYLKLAPSGENAATAKAILATLK